MNERWILTGCKTAVGITISAIESWEVYSESYSEFYSFGPRSEVFIRVTMTSGAKHEFPADENRRFLIALEDKAGC